MSKNKKFVSSSILPKDLVRSTLLQKIEEENSNAKKLVSQDTSLQPPKNLYIRKGKVNVVSLFSGAGGLDLGLELSGIAVEEGYKKALTIINSEREFKNSRESGLFNIVYSNDNFKEANQTYSKNFSSRVFKSDLDIRKVADFPECQIIVGGFPCPGFSAAGPRLIDDPRNFLYVHFIRALMDTQPDFFVAENVKGLLSLGGGEVFKQVVEDFASAGYEITANLVNSRDYGVPQLRERVFIVGVHKEKIAKKYNFHYQKPEPTNGKEKLPFVTLEAAIKDLEDNPGPYFEGGFSPMYLSRNRKKKWEQQSFTIQASGRQAPLHPSGSPMKKVSKDAWQLVGYNRRLSVKEIARIQTFPDWFKFSEGKSGSANNKLNQQYKQIGNAVPVKLAFEMLLPIAKFYKEHQNLVFRPKD